MREASTQAARASELRWTMTRLRACLLIATFAQGVAAVLVALSGVWSAAGGADEPVIDPDVRVAIGAGPVRVLVDLRVSSSDPSAIASRQDDALRRPREQQRSNAETSLRTYGKAVDRSTCRSPWRCLAYKRRPQPTTNAGRIQ